MPGSFKHVLHLLAQPLRMPGMAFWLQSVACAIVAWSLLHGGVRVTPARDAMAAEASVEANATSTADTAADPAFPGTASASQPSPAAMPPGLAAINIVVAHNDTLDRIFRHLKLDLADLAALRSLPDIRASLDSLRPGETLHLTHKDGKLYGLERRLNDTQTLRISRTASGLRADVLENLLEMHARTVRGVIDSSLFEAVEAAGAHDQTALALADIFGWDVDFVLDVRHGDSFVVTYQEVWRDGAYVKDGPILAAEFVNQGHTFRAVRYTDPQGGTRFYTPEGLSVQKAFLRAPVAFTRVSSRFNSARWHPILNRIQAHQGVDYAAPTGTPVLAAGDGRIRYAGPMSGYGNFIEIQHSPHIVTVYGHLSRFARGTRAGAYVTQGTVIGYVGMTGFATGPHLHYEYRVDGVFKNPQTVTLPGAAPIDEHWRADFLARSAPLLATLDAAPAPLLVAR